MARVRTLRHRVAAVMPRAWCADSQAESSRTSRVRMQVARRSPRQVRPRILARSAQRSRWRRSSIVGPFMQRDRTAIPVKRGAVGDGATRDDESAIAHADHGRSQELPRACGGEKRTRHPAACRWRAMSVARVVDLRRRFVGDDAAEVDDGGEDVRGPPDVEEVDERSARGPFRRDRLAALGAWDRRGSGAPPEQVGHRRHRAAVCAFTGRFVEPPQLELAGPARPARRKGDDLMKVGQRRALRAVGALHRLHGSVDGDGLRAVAARGDEREADAPDRAHHPRSRTAEPRTAGGAKRAPVDGSTA